MKKEEILQKSREENKGKLDERELAVFGRASRIGMLAGALLCVVLVLVGELVLEEPIISLTAWMVYFTMQGSSNLVLYKHLKNRAKLIYGIVEIIFAIAFDIPSIIGVEIDPEWEGKTAVLDGDRGCLYIDPDEDTLSRALERQRQRHEERMALLEKARQPCITLDGYKVQLCANIGSPQEAVAACENGCQGIGLFRSEYLYLGRDVPPTEEEQFIAYQQTVLALNGMKVVIRTLDVGADKQVPCLHQPVEVNPALGCRGIRYSLAHPDLFCQQLRAILRAAAFGPISVMFPMVTCVEEIRAAKELLYQCQAQLEQEHISYGMVEIGTMIETPAAVLLADELAQEVNFFSLGTNDLMQYTLAVDRMNPSLESMFNPRHPALLRMLRQTVRMGHRYGCWVGLCGEMAADPELVPELLKLGFDELSVSPGALLEVREAIRNSTMSPSTKKVHT